MWRLGNTKILPPPGLARAIAFQSAIIAIGGGTYLTGGIVFFTTVVGLSAQQIGLGLSVASAVGFLTAMPLGHLVDRVGGQRAWVVGALAEALSFAAYPLVRGMVGYVVLMIIGALADGFANTGRSVYTAEAFPASERVTALAYARTYLNVGFTLGAGLGAAALAINSTAALSGVVLANAVGLVANAAIVSRLPRLPATASSSTEATRPNPLAALRDWPYLATAVLSSALWFHAVIFTEVIPLWAIKRTDAPRPILGALFALNTVLAVALQVKASKGADSLPGAARHLRWAAWASLAACPAIVLSGHTHGLLTVAILAAAVMLTTATELLLSAANWFIVTEVPPANQRGAYIGANQTIAAASRTIAPSALIFLALYTGDWGWLAIGALFLACAVAAGPVIAWVSRTSRVGAVKPEPAALS